MANPKTQLKLMQMSGSLNESVAAVVDAARITDTSLQGVLDHLASSVKKIQGASYSAPTASTGGGGATLT